MSKSWTLLDSKFMFLKCTVGVHVPAMRSIIHHLKCNQSFSPGLIVFSHVKLASELSEGMLWMDDRGRSVSVLVSHVDSVSLVQLSMYRGSRASVLLPPQPIALHLARFTSQLDFHSHWKTQKTFLLDLKTTHRKARD